ncbi:hypothetical protein KAFR_0E02420 [Kazachstania africana CBS 2517]|uniref:SWIRM domain-containing protein n=1 Tax=Kazachstania africana (strain ATCC 22294 / BCRC 22015 / CBS 2517 / CECT 1963 / NBRC 1671 / NRRL Y-8276) TaxID=1071382 RepID=H2AVJ5_KAZAF|nr:hypothetical protein KAFR_0E02420 [Kazachstania africana CBS 2517]CCF58395.1 hypothetical protein KAFR_0E02420 [Kazachstania africana CBS 2517]
MERTPKAEYTQLNRLIAPKSDHVLKLLQDSMQFTHSNSSYHSSQLFAPQPQPIGSSNSITDNRLIPSPPQSPKNNEPSSNSSLDERIEDNSDSIVVKAVWDPELTTRNYRYITHSFLSQYRFQASVMKQKKNHRNSPAGIRKAASLKHASSSSDIEKSYRRTRTITRPTRSLEEHDKSEQDSTRYYSPLLSQRSKSTTSSKQLKKLKPTLSSPLASAKVISNVPQYVPTMSWQKLPDYAPSLDTLPKNNDKCLKVEWKGSSMDLADDPLKEELHPAELLLAQILRLPCDLYLDSKRRFFLEKVHRFKKGLPFRRTDAQKACRIDVNKASRLFAAFEKVGWLQDSHYQKYL